MRDSHGDHCTPRTKPVRRTIVSARLFVPGTVLDWKKKLYGTKFSALGEVTNPQLAAVASAPPPQAIAAAFSFVTLGNPVFTPHS